MIPTPDLSHLTQTDYDLVYEPAGTEKQPPQKPCLIPALSPTSRRYLPPSRRSRKRCRRTEEAPTVCLPRSGVGKPISSVAPSRLKNHQSVRPGSGCVSAFLASILGQSSRKPSNPPDTHELRLRFLRPFLTSLPRNGHKPSRLSMHNIHSAEK